MPPVPVASSSPPYGYDQARGPSVGPRSPPRYYGSSKLSRCLFFLYLLLISRLGSALWPECFHEPSHASTVAVTTAIWPCGLSIAANASSTVIGKRAAFSRVTTQIWRRHVDIVNSGLGSAITTIIPTINQRESVSICNYASTFSKALAEWRPERTSSVEKT
jgi:hypothetical protein